MSFKFIPAHQQEFPIDLMYKVLEGVGRIAQPHEVAQAVLAVATHLTFSRGRLIPVDGGRPLT